MSCSTAKDRSKASGCNRATESRLKSSPPKKSSATPEQIPLDILFEDEHIIAVNKPAGLLAHPSNTEKSGALTNALAYHFWQTAGAPIRPGLVHRLDLQHFGSDGHRQDAARAPHALETFRERRVQKFYLALLSGRMEKDSGEVDAPIGSDPKVWPHWRVTPEGEGGKSAQTRYRVKRRFKAHTLVELEPLTGRTHQLRIHCDLIGHPDRRRPDLRFDDRSARDETQIETPPAARGAPGLSPSRDRQRDEPGSGLAAGDG